MRSRSRQEPRATRVALFGFYQYGNFGDDLMLAILGRELKKMGAGVRVFCTDQSLLRELGLTGVRSVPQLLRGADLVVYGGGGAFLASNPVESFHEDLEALRAACVKRRLPLVMISVGGDGYVVRRLHPARRKLLEAAHEVTFRNREDSVFLKHIGGRGAIHDDIVWQTPRYFPGRRPSQRNDPITIGLDASMLGSPLARRFLHALHAISRAEGTPCRWLIYNQNRHLAWPENFPGVVSYRSIRGFVRAILQSDVILTHRLHLGIVAMSYDIPVLQLAPHKKAEILFGRLGLLNLLVKQPSAIQPLARAILSRTWLRTHRPSQTIAGLGHVIAGSRKHLVALRRWVRALERKC